MDAGLVGLPNTGKTVLFNALTGADADTGAFMFSTTKATSGIANVPDPRLTLISEYISAKKIVPATLKVVDIPGLVRGSSHGEGMGNQFLADVRNVDALLHVVRCFDDEDVLHVDDTVDPQRDIETIDLELIAADLQVVENALDKARKQARLGQKDAKARLSVLEKCQAVLGELQPVRSIRFTDPEEIQVLKSIAMITAKPVLYVANVNEDDPSEDSDYVQQVKAHAREQGGEVVVVSAKLEAEIAELDDADRAEMLESLGLSQPALATVAQGAYRLLGMQSFYTAGDKENRAWTIPIGATAPQAAGAIHSDFERGFIRVEVFNVDDLAQYKTEQAIKQAGKMRLEGKNYVMQDGDVCHFLFNV